MLKRCAGALAALLLVFGTARPLFGPCAQHDTATHQHQHAQHGPAKPKPCTCLDHCQSCPGVALDGVAPTLDVATIVLHVPLAVHSTPPSPVPDPEFFLPLATAPPVVS